MKENERELKELLSQLNVGREQSEIMAREIGQGDELFDRSDGAELSEAARSRLQERIGVELARRRRRVGWTWRRVGAIAAAVIITLVGVQMLWLNQSDPVAGPVGQKQESLALADELALWELSLLEQDYEELEIDDLMITEAQVLLDDLDRESGDPIGRGTGGEIYAINVVGFDRISGRRA